MRDHPGKDVVVWYEDQMRFGQKGRLETVWGPRGSRPERPRQAEFESVHQYGAVDPSTGRLSAMFAPECNAEWMREHLRIFSAQLRGNEVAVLVHDNAAWHTTTKLVWPANVVPYALPSYCPDLNPIERLWLWLRREFLSNRVHGNYEALLEALQKAHDGTTSDRIMSVCRTWDLRPAS
jgi:transposase